MDLFSIALSGMQAAQTQLSVAASNIANADTPGYQSRRADLVSLSTGGVAVAGISKDPAPGPADENGQTGSNVDLASEMMNLTRAKLLYTANAAVIRIGERTTGALLDILNTDNGSRRQQA